MASLMKGYIPCDSCCPNPLRQRFVCISGIYQPIKHKLIRIASFSTKLYGLF